MLRIIPRFVFLIALVCMAGCVETVKSRNFPALNERREPITRLAVAPFRAMGSLSRRTSSTTAVPPEVATALVARYVTEALAARGFPAVPADDVARALAMQQPIEERLVPRAVAQVVSEKFGADAVLLGSVTRFDERRGQAAGATHPAAVGFEVTLYTAPGAQKLWNGVFAETQQALSENIFSTHRYPGGGMRWLTAEELAKWGAEEMVLQIPLW
jgi:hypothetical protein